MLYFMKIIWFGVSMASVSTAVSDKISQHTSEYLSKTLAPDFYASDFSQQHFDALLNELFDTFGEEKTHSRVKIIRKSIQQHFVDLSQNCEVSIVEGKIKTRNIFHEGVKCVDINKAKIGLNLSLKAFVDTKEEYALQEHLLCYPQDKLQGLYEKFEETSMNGDYASLRNTIRASVQESFELDTKDIVLFLRKSLYVRYFVDMRCIKQDDNRRFTGISPEYLEQLYKDNFPEDFEEILFELAPDIFKDALDFSRIDNFTFKTIYIEVFRTLVDVAMADYIANIEKESVLGLNGYILRLHFDNLLYLCAELLIDKVMSRDRKADEFLRFYNGETIIGNGGKNIKKPFVTDEANNIWNYNSIFSIMTQCSQFESQYKQQEAVLKDAQSSYATSQSVLEQSLAAEKKCSSELSAIKDELHACTSAKDGLRFLPKPSKDEREELRIKTNEERTLLGEHDKLYSLRNELTLKLDNAKITDRSRQKQLDFAKRTLVTLAEKGKELDKQQDSIFAGLAKALIFR